MKYRMIYVCFADYLELCKKGVAPHGILARGDQEFFERFINVHIGASTTQVLKLDDNNSIYEFGIGATNASFALRFWQLIYSPFYLLLVIWNVYKIAKLERADFIRGTDPYWCGFIAFLVSRLAKIPCCVSLHADYEKLGRISKPGTSTMVLGSVRLGKLLARFLLRRADMILPIRKNLGAWAVENGAHPKKVGVIPHGIDLGPFAAGPAIDIYKYFDIDPSLKIISFIGRLSRENYIDDVFKFSRLLGERRSDFITVIAGEGSEYERLRRLADQDRVLKKSVKMVGFQKQEVCFDLRKSSNFALCLMGGFSLIEAAAAGRPVVSYAVDWHCELVKDNETGFLVKEGDLDNLVTAVEYILDHVQDSARMGKNAKELAFERHDIQKTNAIKRSYYQKLLECHV
jgi:glycosyltransferase involved in cell wall biosynthesis